MTMIIPETAETATRIETLETEGNPPCPRLYQSEDSIMSAQVNPSPIDNVMQPIIGPAFPKGEIWIFMPISGGEIRLRLSRDEAEGWHRLLGDQISELDRLAAQAEIPLEGT